MFAHTYETLSTPQNWGGVTDPVFHDANNFRYLVHGLNPTGWMSATMSQKIDAENGITQNEDWGDQRINLYDKPEKLGERVALSMSLVDQNHKGTWGEGGLIVGAATENIVITQPTDNGTNNNNLDQVLAQAAQQPRLSGDSLLAQTSLRQYNEVVAICKQGAHPLELKGFFIKTSPAGEPLSRQLADQMRDHARRLGLPLVQITVEAFYTINTVDIKEDGRLAVEYNGSRYLLKGYKDSKFIAYDGMIRPSFPAPSEIEAAVAFGVSSGNIAPDLAAQVLENYATFDRQRQTPTVRFNDDGSVNGISYKTGYGKDENKVQISSVGYTSCINLAKQLEVIKNIGLSTNSRQDNGGFQMGVVSPQKADKMVARACAQLDEASAQRVYDWYSACRSKLEQQWNFHESQRQLDKFAVSSLKNSDIFGFKNVQIG
jgi:hypothetical protein